MPEALYCFVRIGAGSAGPFRGTERDARVRRSVKGRLQAPPVTGAWDFAPANEVAASKVRDR